MYHILSYTRIKPRSRPPQKKSAYFTHPDFSVAKIEKKCANYANKYGICRKSIPCTCVCMHIKRSGLASLHLLNNCFSYVSL